MGSCHIAHSRSSLILTKQEGSEWTGTSRRRRGAAFHLMLLVAKPLVAAPAGHGECRRRQYGQAPLSAPCGRSRKDAQQTAVASGRHFVQFERVSHAPAPKSSRRARRVIECSAAAGQDLPQREQRCATGAHPECLHNVCVPHAAMARLYLAGHGSGTGKTLHTLRRTDRERLTALVEAAMLASVTGLAYHLSTSFRLEVCTPQVTDPGRASASLLNFRLGPFLTVASSSVPPLRSRPAFCCRLCTPARDHIVDRIRLMNRAVTAGVPHRVPSARRPTLAPSSRFRSCFAAHATAHPSPPRHWCAAHTRRTAGDYPLCRTLDLPSWRRAVSKESRALFAMLKGPLRRKPRRPLAPAQVTSVLLLLVVGGPQRAAMFGLLHGALHSVSPLLPTLHLQHCQRR